MAKFLVFTEKTEISKSINGLLVRRPEDGELLIQGEDGESITLTEVYADFIGRDIAVGVKTVVKRDLTEEEYEDGESDE